METEKVIEISCTERGYPAIWEMGGALEDLSSGYSRIITNSNKRPMPFVCASKSRTVNGEHCLILLHPGDYIVDCEMKLIDGWFNFRITEWRVVAMLMDYKAKLQMTNSIKIKIIENDIDEIEKYSDSYQSAILISLAPKCKIPMFVDWNIMDANLARKILNEEGEILFSNDNRMKLNDPKEVIKNIFRCNSYDEAVNVATKRNIEILMLDNIPYGLRGKNGRTCSNKNNKKSA